MASERTVFYGKNPSVSPYEPRALGRTSVRVARYSTKDAGSQTRRGGYGSSGLLRTGPIVPSAVSYSAIVIAIIYAAARHLPEDLATEKHGGQRHCDIRPGSAAGCRYVIPSVSLEKMGDQHISLELRAVEQKFDNAYRSNPLVGAERTTATWTLLSVFEDMIALPLLGPNSANVQTSSHRENLLINGLKHALRWVRECPTDGRLQSRYNDDRYGNASDLLMLGSRYDTIVTIFTYANRGYCRLTLEGDCVVPAPLIDVEDARYYAYNRFLQADSEPWSPPSTDLLRLLGEIAESVIVLDHGFRVSITPRLIARVIQEQRTAIDRRFQLPGDWRTTRYSFADFQRVYSAFSAIAAVHLNARLIAVQHGAESLGFDDAVIIYSVNELHSRIRRYTRLGGDTISAVVEDLTYGSRGVSSPDPALQPLVPVGNDTLLISPSLILCSSPERNHCVLLNSIPDERKVYAALVDRKEAITRKRIVAAATGKGYRSYKRNGSRTPDRSRLNRR